MQLTCVIKNEGKIGLVLMEALSNNQKTCIKVAIKRQTAANKV